MKNVINNLLRDVYLKIPSEILNEGFSKLIKESQRTLDAVIKEHIIVDIVLANCNLYSGKTKKITLEARYGKDMDDTLLQASMSGNYGVYTIPLEARENRPIVAVLDIAYPTTMAIYGTYPNIGTVGRSVTNGIDEALSSFTHSPGYTSPTPMIIDGDAGIIQLSPPASVHVDWILSCMLAYDKEFSNISLNMLNPLKRMTEHATKAFIYNELIVKLNQGYLQGGLALEAIRSIIEGYQNSNEAFDEALIKFRGASIFTHEGLREMISLMI